jgi:two-component system, response regulator PdtaR
LSSKVEDEGSRGRVAIVEDEVLLADFIEVALTDAGFTVVGKAVDADQAISLLRKEQPDVAVLDIRLGGPRNGVDVAIEIMRSQNIKVIFATAESSPAVIARAKRVKAARWLPKPYDGDQMIAAVEAAMAQRHADSKGS